MPPSCPLCCTALPLLRLWLTLLGPRAEMKPISPSANGGNMAARERSVMFSAVKILSYGALQHTNGLATEVTSEQRSLLTISCKCVLLPDLPRSYKQYICALPYESVLAALHVAVLWLKLCASTQADSNAKSCDEFAQADSSAVQCSGFPRNAYLRDP